jgi:hypothetical protein
MIRNDNSYAFTSMARALVALQTAIRHCERARARRRRPA